MSRGNGSTQMLALRRRLDTMGYQDFVLGLDSAPLAQQLLNDVLTTTKELQVKEEELNEVKAELETYKPQIEIFQGQLQRLTRENEQLHQKIISVSENAMKKVDQSETAMIEAQTESRRTKLLADQKDQVIKDLQNQLEKTKHELQDALEAPGLSGNVSEYRTRDPSKSRRTGSRSRRTGSIAPSLDRSSYASQQEHEMEVKALKDEIQQLKDTIENKEHEAQSYIQKINQQQELIKLRDDEILRLGEELQHETGRDGYMMTLRHLNQQQAAEIEKLKAQVKSGINPMLSPQSSAAGSPLTRKSNNSSKASLLNEEDSIPTPRKPPQPLFASKDAKPQIPQQVKKEETINAEAEKSSHVVFDIPQEEKANPISIIEEEEEEDVHELSSGVLSSSFGRTQKMQTSKNALIADELKESLDECQGKIEELKHEKESLEQQLEKAEEQLNQKNVIIAEMTANFAFVGDNINTVLAEKDKIIANLKDAKEKQQSLQMQLQQQQQLLLKQKAENNDNDHKEQIETLQMQIDELQTKYETDIEEKDNKIAQLESLVEQITNNNAQQESSNPQIVPLTECKQCAKLRAELEDLKKNAKGMSQEDTIELHNLRERTAQLELIIRSSEETMRESNSLNQELLMAQNKITEREQQYEKLRQAGLKLQKEFQSVKEQLEEERKTSGTVPELKQRYRTILDRMKIEHAATVAELKQTKATLQTVSDKLLESQKLTRMFQEELQKARDQANTAKEESLLHRTKSEEIQHIASEKLVNCQKEMNAATNHYKGLIQDLTNKNNALQQILSDTRRQTAICTEQTIPKLKETVLKLTRERSELSARVESLAQLSQFAEKSTKFSPETVQFIAALHQLQDTLRPFLP